ncbi:PREDICTED: nucleoside diphosphate-linked moiety X motif 19-like [Rhagoletis zephyria]|uniref:nucleoside diphosphate-linked moiety X motif 19-like n=1 Tax=Rhagoletis zephyria TaxID=28612 RepID=UPI000811244A|nr:PREDICTED: nucleoside diphosphate-linked moiety X motif 19-like [Rhagoletis zephyria]
MWRTPMDFLQRYFGKDLFLPPPQLYELSRFLNYKRLDELLEFEQIRSKEGITHMLPVIQNCTDGSVSLLPGGDFYPSDPQGSDQAEVINLTMMEYRSKTQKLHRIEFFNNSKPLIQLNCSSTDDHFSPTNI